MKWLMTKAILAVIQRRLEAGTRLLLFLNYDEALAAGASGGAPAPLDLETRDRLRELSEVGAVTLTVVSDQSLATLKKLVGFSGIYFIANHGLEIFGPDLNVVHAEAKRAKQALHVLGQTLAKRLAELPGVSLDDRGLSLAVSFSEAKPALQRRARLLVEEVWTPVMDGFTLLEKNQALILRPRVGWTTGRAVMFLWNKFASPRRRPLVLYIGGDDSEEEIYNFMGREGLGIIVGGETRLAQSKAEYFLKSRQEVGKFITWLARNFSRLSSHASEA
jgi:trehalose-phosphatase